MRRVHALAACALAMAAGEARAQSLSCDAQMPQSLQFLANVRF